MVESPGQTSRTALHAGLSGDKLYVSVESQTRIDIVGHRGTVNRKQGGSGVVTYTHVHIALDDVNQLSYMVVLAYEQKTTMNGSLSRAMALLNGHRV
jgi:hypothetical protein